MPCHEVPLDRGSLPDISLSGQKELSGLGSLWIGGPLHSGDADQEHRGVRELDGVSLGMTELVSWDRRRSATLWSPRRATVCGSMEVFMERDRLRAETEGNCVSRPGLRKLSCSRLCELVGSSVLYPSEGPTAKVSARTEGVRRLQTETEGTWWLQLRRRARRLQAEESSKTVNVWSSRPLHLRDGGRRCRRLQTLTKGAERPRLKRKQLGGSRLWNMVQL